VNTIVYREAGVLSGTLWVGGDGIAKAVDAMLDCIRRFAPFFADRARAEWMLASLKHEAAQERLERFDGINGAVDAARLLFLDGVSDEWLAEYAHRLDSVSPEDMRRAVARYLAPADLHIVLVSNPAVLDALRLDWPAKASQQR
jgi:hypothetical protein